MVNIKDKEKLIHKIKNIENQDIIEEIYRLIDIEFDDTPYLTNEDQKNAIQESRTQIESGDIINGDIADKEIDEWLGK